MSISNVEAGSEPAPRTSLIYDPKVRSLFFQALLILVLVGIVYVGFTNAANNLAKAGIASGFGFFSERAGFDIGDTLISYTSDSTYLRAFLVGLLNTLLVAALGIFFATIIGFLVGLGRLSQNVLIRGLATVYVETFRNVPLLLQLLFWYKAVLSVLPSPRGSYAFLDQTVFLNNRGLFLPKVVPGLGAGAVGIALVVAIILAIGIAYWATVRQTRTGKQFPKFFVGLAVVIALPLIVFIVLGAPVTLEFAELKGFNFGGGTSVRPEFLALLLGLSIYTASFIAEIVRSGINAVAKGQSEAAFALGLRPNLTTRLIIIPQALRVIIPPLTSQYLNLTKNSSLAVAIGFPDLVSVSGTILNQTGQAVEVIAITMLVYLTISLLTSAFMNWFNARVALTER
jgi:general L-amino acid transport system permease protein